jgi:hypothetical protein
MQIPRKFSKRISARNRSETAPYLYTCFFHLWQAGKKGKGLWRGVIGEGSFEIIFVNESDYLAGGLPSTTAEFPSLRQQQLPSHLHTLTALGGDALRYPPRFLHAQPSPLPAVLPRGGGDVAQVLRHSGEHLRLQGAAGLPQLRALPQGPRPKTDHDLIRGPQRIPQQGGGAALPLPRRPPPRPIITDP